MIEQESIRDRGGIWPVEWIFYSSGVVMFWLFPKRKRKLHPGRYSLLWLLFRAERAAGRILIFPRMARALFWTKVLRVLNKNRRLLRLALPISQWMINRTQHSLDAITDYMHRYPDPVASDESNTGVSS